MAKGVECVLYPLKSVPWILPELRTISLQTLVTHLTPLRTDSLIVPSLSFKSFFTKVNSSAARQRRSYRNIFRSRETTWQSSPCAHSDDEAVIVKRLCNKTLAKIPKRSCCVSAVVCLGRKEQPFYSCQTANRRKWTEKSSI